MPELSPRSKQSVGMRVAGPLGGSGALWPAILRARPHGEDRLVWLCRCGATRPERSEDPDSKQGDIDKVT